MTPDIGVSIMCKKVELSYHRQKSPSDKFQLNIRLVVSIISIKTPQPLRLGGISKEGYETIEYDNILIWGVGWQVGGFSPPVPPMD